MVKVGVINTFSGPTVAQGDMMERGLQAYYKTHQKDLPKGVTIELVERDDTGIHPDIAKRLASELIVRDKVQLLIGAVCVTMHPDQDKIASANPASVPGATPAIAGSGGSSPAPAGSHSATTPAAPVSLTKSWTEWLFDWFFSK